MEKVVITELLTQGKEYANELKNQLHPNSNTQRKACNLLLLEKILSKYDNALSVLTLDENKETSNDVVCNSKRKGSHSDSKNPIHNHVAKKRKPKWSEQECCRKGVDQLGGDGYSWRKYGQKPILGANNPRSYYRCTHRRTQGCLATKQVQQTDEDSSMYDVNYNGKHTCIQETAKRNKEDYDMLKKEEMVISNEQCLKVENQELGSNNENVISFSFPSTPIESGITETPIFSSPTNFGETSYLPPFSSSATSESYFQASLFQVNDFGFAPNFQDVSDLPEIMSNPTPFTDFQLDDVDFSINQVRFESLEDIDYFSQSHTCDAAAKRK